MEILKYLLVFLGGMIAGAITVTVIAMSLMLKSVDKDRKENK